MGTWLMARIFGTDDSWLERWHGDIAAAERDLTGQMEEALRGVNGGAKTMGSLLLHTPLISSVKFILALSFSVLDDVEADDVDTLLHEQFDGLFGAFDATIVTLPIA